MGNQANSVWKPQNRAAETNNARVPVSGYQQTSEPQSNNVVLKHRDDVGKGASVVPFLKHRLRVSRCWSLLLLMGESDVTLRRFTMTLHPKEERKCLFFQCVVGAMILQRRRQSSSQSHVT